MSVKDGLRGDGRDNRYVLGYINSAGHRQVFLKWRITTVSALDTVIHSALISYF